MPRLNEIAKAVRESGKPFGTWSLLIYGASKMGKTALAGTIAKVPYIEDVYYFDLENGSETLVTMVKEKKLTEEQAAKITIYKIPDTKQSPMAMETIMKCLTVRSEHIICEPHGKISCVVCANKNAAGQPDSYNGQVFDIRKCKDKSVVIIDSGSQLGNSIMSYYLMGKSVDYKPGWDEYGPQGLVLHDALTIVQNARTNFIVITHELGVETVENDEKIERIYPLMGTKNFSRNCAKYFSHVAYLEKKMNLHKGGTSSTYRKDVITGSRAGWRLEDSKVLDLSLLFSKLKDGIGSLPAGVIENVNATSNTPE